ncbi:Short-chain dehydrogenase [Pedobacter westerhofensis]|uniref:Short-chain dehydrogenase n=1 Tax=Pedobacter westerhofensis TaxID=425512 RepID=A0A521FKY7_9SPHI|nr:SDR family oxidoreductase [Pedobacter westerhofensis]SMO96796.1 Short-chain dehydrogenase [Pedobacter westerhofensis]
MDLQLENKTAFITGSTQGIGFAIARALLREGVQVIINGRTQEKVTSAVERLQNGNINAAVTGIAADLADPADTESLVAQLPPIDILVNNVGIFEMKEFSEISDNDWQRMFDVNVMSGVRLSRALLPKMLARNWGRILFISSESGINIPANMIHYGLTKTAMISLSRGLAQLTKNTGVTVNTLIIGPTYSDGVSETVEAIAAAQTQDSAVLKQHLIGSVYPTSILNRFLDPAEVADIAVFLTSPLALATNGAAVRADGGVLNTIL